MTFPYHSLLSGISATISPASLAEPFYEGSVQRLYAVPGDDSVMVTQTTARGSVFDVGALFEIPGNDVNRAVFRHVLYSKLGQPEVWRKVRESIRNAPELADDYREDLLSGALDECCENGARTHQEGLIAAGDARETLRAAGQEEIGFYRDAGKLEDFAELNAV